MPCKKDLNPLEFIDSNTVNASVGVTGSLFTRLMSGGAWVLAGRLIAATSSMVVTMLLSRMLMPEVLGNYFIISSVTVTGALLAQFGTHQSVVRLVAGGLARRDYEELGRSLRAIFAIALTGATLIGGCYAIGLGGLIGKYIFKSEAVQAATEFTVAWLILRQGQTLLAQTFSRIPRPSSGLLIRKRFASNVDSVHIGGVLPISQQSIVEQCSAGYNHIFCHYSRSEYIFALETLHVKAACVQGDCDSFNSAAQSAPLCRQYFNYSTR